MHVKNSGVILLTKHDLLEHAVGNLSSRVKEVLQFNYEELTEVIKSGQYNIIEEIN